MEYNGLNAIYVIAMKLIHCMQCNAKSAKTENKECKTTHEMQGMWNNASNKINERCLLEYNAYKTMHGTQRNWIQSKQVTV